MGKTEKITINLSVVDLGKIDLLVEEGFYSNRTDAIRTAIRNQLVRHDDEVKQTVKRNDFVLGVLVYTKEELLKYLARKERLSVRVVGMLVIADSVPPDLAKATFHSIKVLGVFKANKAVSSVLADKIL